MSLEIVPTIPNEIAFEHTIYSAAWRDELRSALRTAEDLVAAGLIPADQIDAYRPVLTRYRFVLPRYYASLIDRTDPKCPIRLQAIPALEELLSETSSSPDPLGDRAHRPVERITHRYRDRVLLHLTPNCSMYCRFCFRKTLLNELSSEFFEGSYETALDYIRQNTSIREVIFSGGDPFLASESSLVQILESLDRIAHVERSRFHTRVPVTLPSRVEPSFVSKITAHSKKTVVVTHFNHPRELTANSRDACSQLRGGGVTLLNQSVLLAGVNDDAAVLESLSEELFSAGVLPYYLHQTDPSEGTGHFRVDPARGIEIYTELRARLSGYLIPRYVVDDVELPYKTSMT